MADILQGMTGTIITSVMQQLRERLPQLRGENPVEVSSVRKKTCTTLPWCGEETSQGPDNTTAMTLQHEMLQPRHPPRMR
ncbi:hypothetical protein LIER_23522 [Lithospermum erythrorhizon]|uniref:Uncharacterized protein n=1 Tax=Lithospermum erythrorhizon TaxID=34254 RepID=A0AAV3R0I9_LITER